MEIYNGKIVDDSKYGNNGIGINNKTEAGEIFHEQKSGIIL